LTVYFFADVYIDVPDTIDITHMRSYGVQPGEELLPEGGQIVIHYFFSLSKFSLQLL